MTKSDENRTRMSQIKDKIVHTPKDVGEEWMKMIWGKSSWQSDGSWGRGREDHIRACLA